MITTSPRTTDPAVTRPVTYSGVLRAPSVFRLLAGTLIGRLPNTMALVGILLITATDAGTCAVGGHGGHPDGLDGGRRRRLPAVQRLPMHQSKILS